MTQTAALKIGESVECRFLKEYETLKEGERLTEFGEGCHHKAYAVGLGVMKVEGDE